MTFRPRPRPAPRPASAMPPAGQAALALMLGALAGAALTPTPVAAQDDGTVVFLVRHAERAEDGTSDPVISLPGWDRARLLAEILSDAGVTDIHTTDYRRTRGTGRPVAEALGLEMQTYDPRDLAGFAERLRSTSGRHLVLGHSNTTPQLVAALGGEPGAPVDEEEYDRLYVVTLTDDGASTVLLRFGAPFER
jgi:phosphohistidine phosphatase SixA